MNLRIEDKSGMAVLKVAAHKTDSTKALLKVPANCEVLIAYVAKFCTVLGITELGNAWKGGTYWMQEVNREQALAAVGKLLAGEALPEVDIPQPTEPDESDYEDDEDDDGDEEGLVS